MTIPHIEEIVNDAFGLWITGLFSAISGHNPDISFAQHKIYFFEAITALLENGKIKFIHPNADCYISTNHIPKLTINDQQAHWNAPAEEIISWLKSKWPENATDENDLEINYYLHEIPAIIWKCEDGQFIGS